jgi:putative ATPase
MKEFKFGKKYRYPHDYPDHFIKEKYLPQGMEPITLYQPTDLGYEKFIRERLKFLWGDRENEV